MSNVLIGKTLTGMQIADDKKALLFQTTEGEVVARADGDCCSDTWIEDVELPALGFPCVVTAAEDLEMPGREDDNEDGEVVAFYGLKLTTDRGDIVIDYRNASNGYYGGNLSWPVPDGKYDPFYGGVFGQNVSSERWVDIPE